MDIKQITCGNCGGMAHVINWKIISNDEQTGIGTAEKEETVCAACNGKGWTEYAIFSVDEAKAILKHCGLSTES